MKFKKTLTAALLIVAISSLGYMYADSKTEVVELSAMSVTHKDLGELENRSELIVTGQPLDSENHVLMDEEGILQEGFTITNFKIDGVFSNSSVKQLNEGDIIKVAEPVYIVDNGMKPGQTQFIIEGYEPMQQFDRYILVLKPDETYPDMNVIVGGQEGKYSLNNVMSRGSTISEGGVHNFKEELINKYSIQ
ncbi:hypothetical protein ACFTQ7_21440 [Lysinibacillus sp. NPDC056959]|uniref:hypothetical protein n=1 Tax=Lysinibacillus sp. NPDC056959 TaxID=3345981 RepID=UPI00363EFFFD